MNVLKWIRILLACLFFGAITLFFVDCTNFIPNEGSWLAKIQFVPSLLSHSWIILASILVGTLLLGRLYCSVVCPLGVLQDGIAWVAKRIHRKKKYGYKKPVTWLRWLVVLLVVALSGFGLLNALMWLDPYSIFGRIATNLLRPVYISANNVLASICVSMGDSTFWYVDAVPRSLAAVAFAFAMLLLVGVLAYRNGRTYCNTICPVGAVLGLLSKFAIFRVKIKKDHCVGCGMCAKSCKSSCINIDAKQVETSRCVDCFNCLDQCKFGAISFAGITVHKPKEPKKDAPNPGDSTRREFVSILAMAAGAGAVASKMSEALGSTEVKKLDEVQTGQNSYVRETPIAPPGARSIAHLLHHCTACHLCVSRCPSHCLKPALLEYGLGGMFVPRMDYASPGLFCNYDCTICSEVCPNGAISILDMAKKHMTQVGRVHFVKENCVVFVNGTFCGACSEHCPTQAVKMIDFPEGKAPGLTLPQIDPDICIGCGACESICPVRPYKAIYIEGNSVQKERKEFVSAEKLPDTVDDFGF